MEYRRTELRVRRLWLLLAYLAWEIVLHVDAGLAEEPAAELTLASFIRWLLSIRLLILIVVNCALADVLEYHGAGVDATPLRSVPAATIKPVHIVHRSPTEGAQTVVRLATALALPAKLLLWRRFAVAIVVDTVDVRWIRYLPSYATYFARSNHLRCVAEATLLNAI